MKNEMEKLTCLADTVSFMVSKDYRERFVAEYNQLKIRYEKLKQFNLKIEASYLSNIREPEHDVPFEILKEQERIMLEYLRVLELRAIIEKIDL